MTTPLRSWLGIGIPEPRAEWHISQMRHHIAPEANAICLDDVRRDWVYGLDYYAGRALPDCRDHPMPIRFHAGSVRR